MWGFATWRAAWRGFPDYLRNGPLPTPAELREAVPGFDRRFYDCWIDRTRAEKEGAVDTFASSWNVFNFLRGNLSLTPPTALTFNYGFGFDASNSKRVPLIAGLPPRPTSASAVISPAQNKNVVPNQRFDLYVAKTQWNSQAPLERLLLAGIEWLKRALMGTPKISTGSDSGSEEEVAPYLTVAQRYFLWRFFRGSRTMD